MMARKDIQPGVIVRVDNTIKAIEPRSTFLYSATRWDVVHAPRKLLQPDGSRTRSLYVALRRGKVQREVRATEIMEKCIVVGHRKEPVAVGTKPDTTKPTSWEFILRDDFG
jgi:hypothetical protein